MRCFLKVHLWLLASNVSLSFSCYWQVYLKILSYCWPQRPSCYHDYLGFDRSRVWLPARINASHTSIGSITDGDCTAVYTPEFSKGLQKLPHIIFKLTTFLRKRFPSDWIIWDSTTTLNVQAFTHCLKIEQFLMPWHYCKRNLVLLTEIWATHMNCVNATAIKLLWTITKTNNILLLEIFFQFVLVTITQL